MIQTVSKRLVLLAALVALALSVLVPLAAPKRHSKAVLCKGATKILY